jgi:hypothetical protein
MSKQIAIINKMEGEDDDMLPEYDFSGGVRNKYAKKLRGGYTTMIHKQDGSKEVHHYVVMDGTVLIDRDLRDYFPDAEAVNNALRLLIQAVPSAKPVKPRPRRTARTSPPKKRAEQSKINY